MLASELDKKHLKKAKGHINWNIVNIAIKMKTTVRKPWMIKIIKLHLRNSDNSPPVTIFHHHHHHHVVLVARISLTLSRHFSLSFIDLAGLLDYIPYPHIVAECIFVLVVLLLLGYMWGSIRVHHLWVHPCFSSSVLHVWFI